MERNVHSSLVIGAALLATLASLVVGCWGPQLRSPEQAHKYLVQNRVELTKLGTQWISKATGSTFCQFSEGEYRYDESFLKSRTDGAFEVMTPKGKTLHKDLSTAIAELGIGDSAFQASVQQLDQMRIRCVTTKVEAGSKYVEIMSEGSQWNSTGLIYAPENSHEAHRFFAKASTQKDFSPDFRVRKLESEWFYFEESR
jgi:hypothetical protein